MNATNHARRTATPAAAILLAFAATSASAGPTVEDLTRPTSTVEAGVGSVSADSYKAGEYDGLQRRGAFAIGNLDLRGGSSYDSNGTTRWSLRARDLGLESRDATARYGQQGLFEFGVGYQELRRNYSDSFQTPYNADGSGGFQLPSIWLKPRVPQVSNTALNYRSLSADVGPAGFVNSSGHVVPPSAAQLTTLSNILNADLPAFHLVDLATKRKSFQTSFAYLFAPQWQVTAGWRRDHKDGLRAQGAINDALNGNSAVILPVPVDETTDHYDLSLNFTGERLFGRLAYEGSMYDNQVDAITWADPNDPTTSATMSAAPSNQFHQLSLTGGYRFGHGTELVAAGHYGLTTQNDAFLSDRSLPLGIPRNSLDGKVITKALSLKLTSRVQRRLNLAAGFKYDERDNESPVNRYVFQDANEPTSATGSPFNAALGLAPGTLGNNINIFDNRPHSRKNIKLDLDADFTLTENNALGLGYSDEHILRRCEGTWYECENSNDSREHSLRLQWRSRFLEDWHSSLGYTKSARDSSYDPNAWLALAPMANVVPGAPVVGATTGVYGFLTQTGLTAWGPVAGFPASPLTGDAAIFTPNNNVIPASLYGSRDVLAELPGMRRFNVADRNRDALRGSLGWDATERLSMTLGADFNRDDYPSTVDGLQRSSSYALNFDATLALSKRLSTSFFYSHERLASSNTGDGYGSNTNAAFVGRAGNTLVAGGCYDTVQLKNRNGKIDPCLVWTADHAEIADTVGLTLRDSGLLRGRLDLAANVAATWARTHIGVQGGSYANNPFALAGAPVLAPGTPAVLFIPATAMPDATNRSLDLRLDGRYRLSQSSALHLGYQFRHLNSSDYIYDGTQFGTLTTVMPTAEHAPGYSVHIVGVSYAFTFH